MSVDAYRRHVQQEDAEAVWARWEEAAGDYNRGREESLREIYADHQRESRFLPGGAVGQFDADAATFLGAHQDPSENRFETYTDESAALAFLFEHLLRGDEALEGLCAEATALTQRQANLDRRLFEGTPDGPQAETAAAKVAGVAEQVPGR
jgi:hypothetical protein